ncbi:hypothetical protein D3C81_1585560 [compost metagenome]
MGDGRLGIDHHGNPRILEEGGAGVALGDLALVHDHAHVHAALVRIGHGLGDLHVGERVGLDQQLAARVVDGVDQHVLAARAVRHEAERVGAAGRERARARGGRERIGQTFERGGGAGLGPGGEAGGGNHQARQGEPLATAKGRKHQVTEWWQKFSGPQRNSGCGPSATRAGASAASVALGLAGHAAYDGSHDTR